MRTIRLLDPGHIPDGPVLRASQLAGLAAKRVTLHQAPWVRLLSYWPYQCWYQPLLRLTSR